MRSEKAIREQIKSLQECIDLSNKIIKNKEDYPLETRESAELTKRLIDNIIANLEWVLEEDS